MSTLERFLLVSAVVLFVIIFYRWLLRFLRRKDIEGSFPYVFPFESKLSGKADLKVDLPNKTIVSPEILTNDEIIVRKVSEKEYPPGVHAIELDLKGIETGEYELRVRFSNQTSRIKIEIE